MLKVSYSLAVVGKIPIKAKVSYTLVAVGATEVRIPMYLGHSL